MPLVLVTGEGQSRVRPAEFVLTQGPPWLALPSQTPAHGDAGVPAHGGPLVEPCRQMGQGWDGVPVRTAVESSAMLSEPLPSAGSMDPPDGAEKRFSTQVESPPFGIGRGVPKLQPGPVQSNAGPGVEVAPSVQVPPLQSAAQRLVAPSGVGPSGTLDAPPPRLSPPHVRSLMTVVPLVSE